MPLFVVECEDVKALSNSQIDLLRCGDYLVKKDASGEHAYKVTFKSDTGMCITYHDASVVETQSYDKIDGVWTYNSEDKSPIDIASGNIPNAKPIYCHPITVEYKANNNSLYFYFTCLIFNNDETPFTWPTFYDYVDYLTGEFNASIMASGGIKATGVDMIVATCLRRSNALKPAIYGMSINGIKDYYSMDKTPASTTITFTDGVNKIN